MKATGFGRGFSTSDIVVEIGGEFSPASADSDGGLLCAVPLFLSDGGEMEIPGDAVDLVVKRAGKVIGEAKGAITVTELPAANGALKALAAGLDTVCTALEGIMGSFVAEPGVQEQYVVALTAAMDSLLHGGGENSLASAIAAIPEGSVQERLADHVASSSGLKDFVQGLADYLKLLEGSLPGRELRHGRASVAATTRVSDEDLARMMEFYTIVQRVAKAETGPYDRNTLSAVAKVEALLGTSGQAVDHVEVSQRVAGFFTELAFYLLPGTLPAELDTFDLTALRASISPGDTTETRIFLTASNDPPQMNLNRLIDQTIINLCDSLTAPMAQGLRARLEDVAVLFLGTMEAKVAQYSAQHPELDLNDELTEDVPDMFWSVDATSPLLYNRQSAPAGLVMPCASVMEWYALPDANGTAILTVATSTSPSGWLLPQMPGVPPYLGSFGDATQTSNSEAVEVGEGTLTISAAIMPSKIPEGRTGQLTVQARYHTDSDSTPAAGAAITLTPHNCSVDPTGGTTDVDGVFRATVTPQADTASVTVSAVGAGGSSASATATAARGRNLLWECYDEYTDNCIYFEMEIPAIPGPVANGIRYDYQPELNSVAGNWWWNVYDIDQCMFKGYFMGAFGVAPNADCNGFTFEVQTSGWNLTVTILVSKNLGGECVWTGSCSGVVVNP
ncbi:MAG: Ig-like domain-containing protein [Candidatus Eisenbacteria bacterium]